MLGVPPLGDVTVQELYFFIGEGANGKSVLVDTVLGVLGDYACTAPESLLTVRGHDELDQLPQDHQQHERRNGHRGAAPPRPRGSARLHLAGVGLVAAGRTGGPWYRRVVVALACVQVAICVPPLELLPFVAFVPSLAIFTFGLAFNAVQANTIADVLGESFGIPTIVTGIVLALICAPIFFGGIRSVARSSLRRR